MLIQIFVPNSHNSTVTIPNNWYRMEELWLWLILLHTSNLNKKQFAWLICKSKIDNPVLIGENFRKLQRE